MSTARIIELMPKLVASYRLSAIGLIKTVNRKLSTENCKSEGFTLIELLITISIIGILSSFTIYSYSSAQQKSRDGVRKNDLAQVKRALELAKGDCLGSWYPSSPDYNTTADTRLTDYLKFNSYMNPVPTDPKNSNNQIYVYTKDASAGNTATAVCPPATSGGLKLDGTANYMLSVQLERTTDTDGQASWTKCSGKPGVPGSYSAGYYYICNN